MRLRAGAQAWWHMLVLSLLWAGAAVLAADDPRITVTKFDHLPFNINYFEDSDVIVFFDIHEQNVYRSKDAGFTWNKVSGVPEGAADVLIMHTFDPKTAFIMTGGTKHYKSDDQGETWTSFETGVAPSMYQPEALVFHSTDSKRIIFNGEECDGLFCTKTSIYTLDGFKTTEQLRSFTSGCWWAKSSEEFTTGDKDLDLKRIMCVVSDPFSPFLEDQRVHISDSFFAIENKEIQEFEPNLDTNKGVSGVLNMAVVKKYILVATKSFGSDEMALYVTDDTIKWHRAMFPTDDNHDHSHRIYQGAYTVLESTNYSIQVDVRTGHPSKPTGVLFTSNSNGTYFIENIPYTNRNEEGHVDFEKISGIQGIFMVNIVENGADVEKKGGDKEIVSKITFDDGRTFEPVKAGEDNIHLHSVTDLNNVGRVFSSPAPGLVMGNGNTGKSLGKFEDADLYVSDNAGLTWRMAQKGPHKYEFGDSGSILVAVKDTSKAEVNEVVYSLDHGENWKTLTLPDDLHIRPGILTTTQDSTSSKFLLVGDKDKVFYVVAIDFDKLLGRTCEDKDMEDWHARVDKEGKPTCIMGHKQTYQRRKKSADCFVRNQFKDPVPKSEDCECSSLDFECDYNFKRDPEDLEKCNKVGPIVAPDDVCKKPDDTFQGSSGWRLIPGNTCNRASGKQKDDPVERKCSDVETSPSPPASGEISHTKVSFDSKRKDFQKFYLERGESSRGNDETIIVRPAEDNGKGGLTVDNTIWLSNDHGKKWNKILEGESIDNIQPHPYFKDVVYFSTQKKKVIYTMDRGENFHSFEPPTEPVGSPLSFHPDMKDWLIWVGKACDKVGGKEDCIQEASISTDRGDNWKTILRYVEKCEFTGHSAYNFRPLKQIVCHAREKESHEATLTLVSSNDFFVEDKEYYQGQVEDFATMSEFIVVAGHDKESGDVRALASLDGKHYEQAHYPHNFHESHEDRYTLLDSSTHAVNLFVLTEGEGGREYGSIIKSNSNGTSYVLSASNVNSNAKTYVDFEKVAGLEGVTLINVVSNPRQGEKTKKLQTKISHNDGSEWAFLPPPEKDVDGKAYKCRSSGDASCALHLHHYTERDDKRKTFAAATAVGLLFGVGNVGSELEDMKDADTFMTTDGGITWKNVKKGHWTWQYGDQGSIIVMVQRAITGDSIKTKTVSYSLDEGRTWADYKFSEEDVTVLDITTLRTGMSRNFLLWCRNDKDELFSVNLDFTGLADKACRFTEDGDSDYYLWSPKHPFQSDDCLFGHVARYLRKKTDRKCYNDQDLKRLHEYSSCACTRRDYECAYNYELDNSGQCVLVQGLEAISGEEWCKQNPNATSWYEPTGYRKLPLSTCSGGNEMDKTSTEHPCVGHEEEFEKKHRTSGFVIFLAVVIPFGLAAAVGWYVYRNWNGKFGQIRLGEQSSTFDSDQPWIKYPVIAVSALAAMAAALPLVVTSLWRTATGAYERIGGNRRQSWLSGGNRRYTTRDSFARGRTDLVDETEGELLGEDSDEETMALSLVLEAISRQLSRSTIEMLYDTTKPQAFVTPPPTASRLVTMQGLGINILEPTPLPLHDDDLLHRA
ncbi:Vacuolar protein sorting-associated protein [Paramyrothecium foliicola]|nr:Vacuolar protein sorting-associated protein [Paramyrothecium foliicola]